MKQCLKIKVTGNVQSAAYREFIQAHAQKYEIEGTIQNMEDKKSVVINACGASEKLDHLIDFVYKGTTHAKVDHVEVEPLLKEKNFRSVFRIIGD